MKAIFCPGNFRISKRYHTNLRQSSFSTDNRSQTAYAGDLLYILSLTFSKSAVLLLIHRITPVNVHQLLISGTAVITLLWSSTGLLAAAFQCQVPRTWEILQGKCVDQVSFPFDIICRLTHRSDMFCTAGILDIFRNPQYHY